MKSIVVAYDQKRGIGANGDLLWLRDLPADLRHFKEVTMGGALIMGRKTYDSIGWPLPGRQNIILSRTPMYVEGVTVVGSLAEAYAAVEPGREIYIIGGGQIYTLALETADRVIATEVKAVFSAADVLFPELDMTQWREIRREAHAPDERNRYAFDFVVYERT